MDKIIAVGQGTKEPVDAVNMRLNPCGGYDPRAEGHDGAPGYPARRRGDAVHKDIILKRDLVSLKDSLAKADIIEHPVAGGGVEKIGVIHLHDFYNNTQNDHAAASDCSKLIGRLKKEKVAGIILDMRNNGGGLLDQAIDLTALFVKGQDGEGEPVVQVRGSDSDTKSLKTEDSSVQYTGPLIVMVNKMSASATGNCRGPLCRITAAPWSSATRARTGRARCRRSSVSTRAAQLGVILDPGNELKMTVQKFYRVAGGSTQEKGGGARHHSPLAARCLRTGRDDAEMIICPTTQIAPVPFDHFNLAAPYVAELRAKSDSRVASSAEFQLPCGRDIKFYKKRVGQHDRFA